MNAELMPAELHAGASWRHTCLRQAPEGVLGEWWDPSLARLEIGDSARTAERAAASYGAVADSVGSARRFGGQALAEWGMSELAENLRLIISELVGNACRHAVTAGPPERTRVTVQMRPLPEQGAVVCMVADPEPRGPVRIEAHHFAESGRGLALVAAFSQNWGWNPVRGHGKVVWAVCGSEPS